jgi:hypothetical protein
LIRSLFGLEQLENLSWRKTFWIALLLTFVCAFSPMTFMSILLWQIILVIFDVIAFNSKNNAMDKLVFDRRNARRIAVTITPLIVNAPWSIEFILHPSRILLDPGLSLAGGEVLSLLLGNPGGVGAPPIWIISPILLIAVIAIFVSKTARLGEVALFFIAIAALLGSRQVSGHGSFTPEQLWVGSLLVIPTLTALLAAVIMIDNYLPSLSQSNIDYRHILLGFTSLISALSILASVARPYLLVSVPREPIWRMLNLLRGAYISQAGNTPGHVQHWSTRAFVRFLREKFEIIKVQKPLPWTMVLCRVRKN